MLETRTVLISQAATLVRELELQRAKLTQVAGFESAPVLIANLRTQLRKTSGELDQLIESLPKEGSLQAVAEDLARHRRRASDLFAEVLAFATAGPIRNAGIDSGICPIADRLLRSLGRLFSIEWPHVTALSDSEFFGTAAQIIRIRYPPSLLDLAVAVHEFGHFFAPRWPVSDGVGSYRSFLKRTDLGARELHYAEFFADLFAVFTVGPAYVASCLLVRFNPRSTDTDTHPGDGKRAAWILECLDLLVRACEGESATIMRSWHTKLAGFWATVLRDTGTEPEPNGALRWNAGKLWKELRADYPDAPYTDTSPALRLRAEFREGRTPDQVTTAFSLRDLLVCAWLERLQDAITGNVEDAAHRMDDWAKELCQIKAV